MLHLWLARVALVLGCLLTPACLAMAQVAVVSPSPLAAARAAKSDGEVSARRGAATDSDPLEDVLRQLRAQQAELARLRAALAEQSRLLGELLSRAERTEAALAAEQGKKAAAATATVPPANGAGVNAAESAAHPRAEVATGNAQRGSLEARLERVEQSQQTVEALSKQLGSITFSGDIRLRYEGQFGLLNTLPNSQNPDVFGNKLSSRNRARIRARLALRGQLGKEFDWGLRFSTGNLPDPISSNQTLTDFFDRKQFGLDQAYITYQPSAVPGLRLQGGKFETPWLSTEMTWDRDVQPEGLNQRYARDFKAGPLKNLTLVAWQLPLLERQTVFVLDANGRVNRELSKRSGRDLALYGAQVHTRFELAPQVALVVSAADLFFSGTQFITPAQFFGGQLQIPATITLPATATTPAQTGTALVPFPRDLLVAGSSLGISAASNNATNRDGRLSSGFNLVDLIGRLVISRSQRFPVTLIFNFVRNTQTRDVVKSGGPEGTDRVIANNQDSGLWTQIQVGRTRDQGDLLFDYTFVRLEKDAVLTPFNFSDIAPQSDVRAHRFNLSYVADPRVILSLTGIVSQRAHGLRGVFELTPPGSLNRPTTRLQLDTSFRF